MGRILDGQRRDACPLLLALSLIVLLAGCGGGGTSAIGVRDAWTRPVVAATGPATAAGGHAAMTGPGSGVVYLLITNSGDGTDTLTDVSSDVAGTVELHRTEIRDKVASMRRVDAVAIPARGEVRFAPGGYHVVLANVRRTLAPGDMITLTLTFKGAGQVQVQAQVREQ